MVEITLTAYELQMAALVGARRQIEALELKLPDKHGFEGLGWDVHCEGALGELAVAKALGRYWSGSCNTFKRGGDVGDVQVRTRSKHHYDLIVRDADRDEDVFILVTGTAPTFRVHGWIFGSEAKQPEWQKDYGNRPVAFFVPKEHLRALP